MAEPKKKRQQRPRVASVPVSAIRGAGKQIANIATVFALIEQGLKDVDFKGSLEVDGGSQLTEQVDALSTLATRILAKVYVTWPELIRIPETVPGPSPNTRNGASKSQELSQPESATKHKKSP